MKAQRQPITHVIIACLLLVLGLVLAVELTIDCDRYTAMEVWILVIFLLFHLITGGICADLNRTNMGVLIHRNLYHPGPVLRSYTVKGWILLCIKDN